MKRVAPSGPTDTNYARSENAAAVEDGDRRLLARLVRHERPAAHGDAYALRRVRHAPAAALRHRRRGHDTSQVLFLARPRAASTRRGCFGDRGRAASAAATTRSRAFCGRRAANCLADILVTRNVQLPKHHDDDCSATAARALNEGIFRSRTDSGWSASGRWRLFALRSLSCGVERLPRGASDVCVDETTLRSAHA